MSNPTSHLDPHLRDLLRADPPAPESSRARVRARLEAAIPAMAGIGTAGRGLDGEGGGGAEGSGTLVGQAAALGWRRAAVAAFLVGGVFGAAAYSGLAGTPRPQIVYVDRSAAVSPVRGAHGTEDLLSVAPAEAPHAAMTGEATPVVAPAAHPVVEAAGDGLTGRRGAAPAHVSRFGQERMLLDDARAALVQGDAKRALERADAHRARFPEGLLSEERDALRVEALVGTGKYDEARSAAAAFRQRSPGSLFLRTVDSAIASIP
jgi:hypothetical protein